MKFEKDINKDKMQKIMSQKTNTSIVLINKTKSLCFKNTNKINSLWQD